MERHLDPAAPGVRLTLPLGLVAATEASARAAAKGLGRADAERVREVAATAMLEALEDLEVQGHLAYGPRDNTVLSRGLTVGAGGPRVDLAAYPVEGAGLVEKGHPGALSTVIAVEPGAFPWLPAVWYMETIVTSAVARGALDLSDPLAANLRRIAFAKEVQVSDLTIAIMDRPRHKEMVHAVRTVGARVALMEEGEIAGALAASLEEGPVDAMVGISGLQETIIAACAVRCFGGDLQARLWPRNDEEREMAGDHLNRIYKLEELAPSLVTGAVTGISGGFLGGVRAGRSCAETETIAFSTEPAVVRRIRTKHYHPTIAY